MAVGPFYIPGRRSGLELRWLFSEEDDSDLKMTHFRTLQGDVLSVLGMATRRPLSEL